MKYFFSFIIFLLLPFTKLYSQENIIPLWSEKDSITLETNEKEIRKNANIVTIRNVHKPTLEIFLPAKQNATGKAVVICPGGGYQQLAYDWEGTDVAKWLNSKGIAAFVLKYRLPKSSKVNSKDPLKDAQRAVRLVRQNSEKWNISKDKIGIMGFSAGGHLASTLGTHYDDDSGSLLNTIDSLSARPNFMVLVYPVITMKSPYTHNGSRNNLLGKAPKKELINYYSNELHINKNTPPTFIVHASDDKAVPVMNSIVFYQALQKENINTEMHIYPKGGHGFGLAIGKGHLQTWVDRFSEWIESLD